MEIPDRILSHIRSEILEITEIRPNITSNEIRIHLSELGMGEALGGLNSQISRHGLSKISNIEEGIEEALHLLTVDNQVDIENALRAWDADPTVENWERLRALKERDLFDRSDPDDAFWGV